MQSCCDISPSAQIRPLIPAIRRVCAGSVLFGLAALMSFSQSAQQTPSGNNDKSNQVAATNAPPDANEQLTLREQQAKPEIVDPSVDPQRHQLTVESAQLLQMAIELKAEIARSNQGTLSLSVVRKAQSISRLAHGAKEEMKHPNIAQR